jgi:uncharacterized membrane protein YbaN (DUF454 family)
VRHLLVAFGCLNVGLGIVGLLLPVMAASLACVTVFMAGDWLPPAVLAVGLSPVAGWMLRRPSRVPETAAAAPS